eukprot:gene2147-2890_t
MELDTDERFYLTATAEVEGLNRKASLWAKAMALNDGDETRAKYWYIRKRVEELAEETLTEQKLNSDTSEKSRTGALSNESDSQESSILTKQKNLIEKVYCGDFGLPRTYWLLWFLLGGFLTFIFKFIVEISSFYSIAITLIFYAIFYFVVGVGLWRAASNYIGPKIWPILTKTIIIFNVVFLLILGGAVSLGVGKNVADSFLISKDSKYDTPNTVPKTSQSSNYLEKKKLAKKRAEAKLREIPTLGLGYADEVNAIQELMEEDAQNRISATFSYIPNKQTMSQLIKNS